VRTEKPCQFARFIENPMKQRSICQRKEKQNPMKHSREQGSHLSENMRRGREVKINSIVSKKAEK